ncbi:MAG: glycosyltransferase family 9 protein [Bacteroidota bacterium]
MSDAVIRLFYITLFFIVRGLAWFSRKRPLRKENVKQILVIELTKLGDLVSTLPLFTSLKESFPHATIAVMVQPNHEGLLSLVPEISTALSSPLSQHLWSILQSVNLVRRGKFDLVISASPSVRHGILVLLSGAKYKFGYLEFSRAKVVHLQPHRIRSVGFRMPQEVSRPPSNLAERPSQLCEALGIRPPDARPSLGFLRKSSIDGAEAIRTLGLGDGVSFIVVHPFAGWSYRTWAIENFEQLIHRILDSHADWLFVIGGDHDRSRLKFLVERFSEERRVRFCIGLPLNELAEVIARARLFIGADSGPLHVATAVGTPSIGLFGPAPPEITGPLASVNSYLYKKVECSPCDQVDCVRKWSPCMSLISVDEVFDKVNQFCLSRSKRSSGRAALLSNSLQHDRLPG